MKKLLLIVILLCGVVMGQEKATDTNNQPALTIYNQNFFVAREYVPLDLSAGVNRAQYAGIASHLEPDSVILRDPAGRALQVLEQNYRNDPISQELLLSFYEGKTIEFLVPTQRPAWPDHQGQSCAQRIRSQQLLRAKLSAAVLYSAHHRSGWRAAFWAAGTAAVSGAQR